MHRWTPLIPSLTVVFGLLGAACSGSQGTSVPPCAPECGDGLRCDEALGQCVPDVEPVCTEGSRWQTGQQAFRDATANWGLDTLAVEGARLSVGDIDGDGWADLIVRRGGVRTDDFAEGGQRHTWLLRNTRQRTFEDVTESSGLLLTRSFYGDARGRPVEIVAFADVDNDGDLDLFTGFGNSGVDSLLVRSETTEIMLNGGEGQFSFTGEDNPIRLVDQLTATAGASFVDVDRDGNIDLWVPQHNAIDPVSGSSVFLQDHLFRGDGTGRFEQATGELGLSTADWLDVDAINAGLAHTRSWGATACDLNGDGWPELLSPSYGRSPNHLWQAADDGDGGVSYRNRSVASGYAFDDDLTWSDNEFARCYCRDNAEAEACDQVTELPRIACSPNWNHDNDREPFRLGGNSGSTSCADIDNDGDLDLFTGEIRHEWAGSGADGSEVLVNTGATDVLFERPGDEALGLALDHPVPLWDEGHMTNAVFDFDNDAWPDLYVGASDYAYNRGLLYHQATPLQFVEVPVTEGIDHNRSHGVVTADFDRDGDLDVVVGHSRARCDPDQPNDCYPTAQVRLFENVLGDGGNWLQLDLVGGPGSNAAAIGARVTVRAGDVTQTQEVSGGYGHYGSQPDRIVHFGLGAACEADVTIRWPDAALSTQELSLVAGHRYRVVQGQAAVEAP